MPDTAGSEKHVQTSLRGIVKTASLNKQHRFRNLYGLINTDMLHLAWKGLKKSSAIADEDITVKEYGADLERNLERLVERLQGNQRGRILIINYSHFHTAGLAFQPFVSMLFFGVSHRGP